MSTDTPEQRDWNAEKIKRLHKAAALRTEAARLEGEVRMIDELLKDGVLE
jgi:hypothetical protein